MDSLANDMTNLSPTFQGIRLIRNGPPLSKDVIQAQVGEFQRLLSGDIEQIFLHGVEISSQDVSEPVTVNEQTQDTTTSPDTSEDLSNDSDSINNEEREQTRDNTATTDTAATAENSDGEQPFQPYFRSCKICTDDFTPDNMVFINCGCAYCVTCLNEHYRVGLSSRKFWPPKCCDVGGIDIGSVEQFLEDDVLYRYTFVVAEYNERQPMYCASQTCSQHIPECRLREDQFITCNSCEVETCKECRQTREAHAGEDATECPELISKEDRELAESQRWKQCPGCKILVEKAEGCHNMTCECGTEFCYHCGQEQGSDGNCGCATVEDEDGWHHRVEDEELQVHQADQQDNIDIQGGDAAPIADISETETAGDETNELSFAPGGWLTNEDEDFH